MARASIDTEMIMVALDDHAETEYFLDLETGEVERISSDPTEGDEEIIEQIENNPERYRRIDPIDSSQAFQVMEDYVSSLPESEAKRTLSQALSRPHPFRTFKDALLSLPDFREKWFRYHDEVYKEFAISWLEEEGVEGDLRPIWFEKKAKRTRKRDAPRAGG